MYELMLEVDADWVFPDMALIGNEGLVGMAGEYSVLEHTLRNYVDSGSLVARRVFDSGVRFDCEFRLGFEDWDFWLEAARRGFRGSYGPATGFLYRRRPESMIRNAVRDRDEVLGQLRRKHRGWINPRNCVQIEHVESPRFAVFTCESHQVLLFTDPTDRSRRMATDEFLYRVAWGGQRKRLGRLPAFLVATSQEFLEELEQRKLLHGVFWHLEVNASRCQSPVALMRTDTGGFEIRDVACGSELGPIALVRTDAALFSNDQSSPLTVRLPGVVFSDMHHDAAASDLLRSIGRARALPRFQNEADAFLVNSENRRQAPVTYGVRSMFGTGALFPIATSQLRLGFVVAGDLGGQMLGHIIQQVSAANDQGWSTHLFWMQHKATQADVVEALFSTITLLSLQEMESLGSKRAMHELLGILSVMDIVVNHECPEWLALCGDLKRLGVDTVFSASRARDSASTRAMLEAALQYEYALMAYVLDSPSLALRLRALGVPSAKLPAKFSECLTMSGRLC